MLCVACFAGGLACFFMFIYWAVLAMDEMMHM